MQIDFPKVPPDVATTLEGAKVVNIISYPVSVNGRRFLCNITFQALIDHLGATSDNGAEAKRAFLEGRPRIEAKTREHLEANGARAVHLTSADF